MTTETKRDSLPILKDRVSLSPELMKTKTKIIRLLRLKIIRQREIARAIGLSDSTIHQHLKELMLQGKISRFNNYYEVI